MNRRGFIFASASSAALVAMNAHFAWEQAFPSEDFSTGPRIKSLRLLTILPIDELKNFYGKILGLPIPGATENSLIVQTGLSTITFNKVESNERPFYHFAFNIPENKIEKALEWQRKRSPIVHPNPKGVHNVVVHFQHWNAHSVFFLDPAGNLLEYIARHDLKNSSEGDFSVKDILYVSEIGFIVDDVSLTGNELRKDLELPGYREPVNNFWPIGDEYGLLLMITKGRVWSSLPNQHNQVGVFKTSVTINNSSSWKSNTYPYEVLVG